MTFIESPHHSSRGGRPINGVVVHYTAGGGAQATARWFQMAQSKVSAHYVIGRDGETIQCVNIDRAAWHAGRSRIFTGSFWTDKVNQRTIGVELCNYGPLHRSENGRFYRRTSRGLSPYHGPSPVYGVIAFDGKAEQVSGFWEPFTDAQYEALNSLLSDLAHKSIDTTMIWGHDEIAKPAGRKTDPGPAFDWYRVDRRNSRKMISSSCQLRDFSV